MLQIIIITAIIIALVGMDIYIGFTREEGKDERGKSILAKASHITMGFLYFVFSGLILVIQFLNVTQEVLEVIVIGVVSLLVVINSVAIMYYRKNM